MERYSLLTWLQTVADKRVLDLASGAGNYSRMFCRLGARQVIGIDASAEMVAAARKYTPEVMPVTYYNQYCGQFSENSILMHQGLCHKGRDLIRSLGFNPRSLLRRTQELT
ncbi:class I SAM-dependent methyltransferase [Endozoicomonas montiporae]|nr:class I SAM-dependent methyltransferase [Endozoicomonas montiporae]